MSNSKKIASFSICGEITLNLHSLNNEGGEGNQILTRQLTVMVKEGDTYKERTVNGISGDMFKHIHAEHLINNVVSKNLDICEGCKLIDPNRISIDSSFLSILKGVDPEEFEENDKSRYLEIKQSLEELEKGSKESKAFIKEASEIEKKYLLNKITNESDKAAYENALNAIEEKLKKGVEGYEEKKKQQDEAKKLIKTLQKKYSISFSNSEKLDKMLEMCSIDDVHGILVTAEKNTLPRKSVIEFGWTVGVPGKTGTETYLHTKFVSDSGEKGSADSSNTGQNIFHRPANRGVYAFICHVEAYRIGFNDISREYPEPDKRKERHKALIESLLHTFLNPRGAMTSSQKPHITGFKGVVSLSTKLVPAPTISPLNENYSTEIMTIRDNLNKLEAGAIEVKEFENLAELSTILTDLAQNTEPYQIQ